MNFKLIFFVLTGIVQTCFSSLENLGIREDMLSTWTGRYVQEQYFRLSNPKTNSSLFVRKDFVEVCDTEPSLTTYTLFYVYSPNISYHLRENQRVVYTVTEEDKTTSDIPPALLEEIRKQLSR